jgi:hypothetical protein
MSRYPFHFRVQRAHPFWHMCAPLSNAAPLRALPFHKSKGEASCKQSVSGPEYFIQ